MTCVIGWVRDGQVAMAADGRTFNGQTVLTNTAQKVVRRGDTLIGHCGHSVLGRAAAEITLPDNPHVGLPWARKVFDRLDERTSELGAVKVDDYWDGAWLVATRFGMWGSTDRSPIQISRPYACLGSGDDFASGAMAVLTCMVIDQGLPVEVALRSAIDIAAEHCNTVGGETVVIQL